MIIIVRIVLFVLVDFVVGVVFIVLFVVFFYVMCYYGNGFVVFDYIDLMVRFGDFIGIVGLLGLGKIILLRVLLGLVVFLYGIVICWVGLCIGYVL